MSDDIPEAVATILGIALAGWILYEIGSRASMDSPVNLELMGALMIVMAIVTAGAVLYFAVKAVMP